VSTTNGLVKLTKATLKLATKTFGPTSYPEMFFKRAQELAEEKDGEIEDVMRNFNAPNLVAHLQWVLEQSWIRFLTNCKSNDMSFGPLQLDGPFLHALANPLTLQQPSEISTLIRAAGLPDRPGPEAPPRPPPQRPQRPPPMMFQQPPPNAPPRHPLPPNQPNPYQPQPNQYPPNQYQPNVPRMRGEIVTHPNQPENIRCDPNFFRQVIFNFGIGDPTVQCPRCEDGRDECLNYALKGVCDSNCHRSHAHVPVIQGSARHNQLLEFRTDCLSRQISARNANPSLPDFR